MLSLSYTDYYSHNSAKLLEWGRGGDPDLFVIAVVLKALLSPCALYQAADPFVIFNLFLLVYICPSRRQ